MCMSGLIVESMQGSAAPTCPAVHDGVHDCIRLRHGEACTSVAVPILTLRASEDVRVLPGSGQQWSQVGACSQVTSARRLQHPLTSLRFINAPRGERDGLYIFLPNSRKCTLEHLCVTKQTAMLLPAVPVPTDAHRRQDWRRFAICLATAPAPKLGIPMHQEGATRATWLACAAPCGARGVQLTGCGDSGARVKWLQGSASSLCECEFLSGVPS
jgi:hypothetical protein